MRRTKTSWLNRLARLFALPGPLSPTRLRRLELEPLEDRRLLAVFTVEVADDNGNNDNTVADSLRAAARRTSAG
jgi:hypothetical protein